MKLKYNIIFSSILVIALVCAVWYIPNTLANGVDTNIGGEGGIVYKECQGVLCYYVSALANREVNGFRLTVVDKYGNRLPGTKSYDYIQNKSQADALTNAEFKRMSGQRTKREIVLATGNLSYTKKKGLDYTVGVDENIPIYMSANTANLLVHNYFVNMGKDAILKLLNDNCSYDYSNYDVEERKTHYVVVEPLAYLKVTDVKYKNTNPDKPIINYYFGTVTEVTYMVKKDGYVLWAETCNTKNNGEYVTGVFGRKYPFALYTSANNSLDKESYNGTLPVTTVAGLVTVDHWAKLSDVKTGGDALKCAAGEILTINGVGAGPLRVKDLVGELSCEDNPNKLPECCDYVDKYGNQPNKNKAQCSGGGTNTDVCKLVTVDCPNNCNSITYGTIKDTDKWDQCIFGNSSFYEWGNQYCSFYCRETVTYDFPSSSFTVNAGGHFTVGNVIQLAPHWGPVHFVGRSECRTQQIKWSQFESDWDAANRNVASKWDDYQIAIKKQSLIDSASRSSSRNCDYYCDSNIWAGGQYFSCCKKTEKKWLECKTGSKNECVKHDLLTGQCLERKNTCVGGYSDTEYICTEKDTPYDHGYTYTSGSTTYKRYDGSTTTIGPISWCSTSSTPSAGVSSARSAYQSAVSRRESLENDIYQCNNWERAYDQFSPSVQVGYTDFHYGSSVFTLNKTLERRTQSQYFVNGNNNPSVDTYKATGTRSKYECKTDGKACTLTGTITYPKNDWVRQYTTKEYDYNLPNNTYRYILKPSGESTSTISSPYTNYIDLGYGNLPVHYSRPSGNYDIYLTFNSFGTNQKFNTYIQNKQCSNRYDCQYRVINDFMDNPNNPTTDPEGLDVVFRVISLTNPFPGKNGTGRTPGSNWNSDSIQKYITRNRNLQDPERIYFDREPMYEIKLTPSVIRQIRSYNRTQTLYNHGGYADFNLDCETGTGRQCKSRFIRETFRTYFNQSRCGMSNDWNRCSIVDSGVR